MRRLTLFLGLMVAVTLAFGSATPAQAANAADFSPGRIIDDYVFTNKDTMSASAIQSFLNSQVPTCDTWGTQPSEYGGGTRAQFGASRGYPAPYTCLKDYTEGGLSAAQIIYNKAQEWRINPQVILVLLQKEQRLVTDDWPWSIQYRSATGYGCPDTAACDTTYYGFTNQVHQAARMFRLIEDDARSNYYPVGYNDILWHPNTGCGTSRVYVENRATSALYNYTPYRPNQAALNNLYGTGDSCSSYGNRNFWRQFSDWFGSTLANAYSYKSLGQGYSIGSGSEVAGETLTLVTAGTGKLYVRLKNTGAVTWSNSTNPVRVANTGYRTSPFQAGSWVSQYRPATLAESSVAPGATGTFIFDIQAPTTPGGFSEQFSFVAEGLSWLDGPVLTFTIFVEAPSYKYQNLGQGYTLNGGSEQSGSSLTMTVGGAGQLIVRLKNTGTATWSNSTNPIRIANSAYRTSQFQTNTWLGQYRPATLAEASVPPGSTGTFVFDIKAPAAAGSYTENFGFVAEGLRWLEGSQVSYQITVQALSYQIISQQYSLSGGGFQTGSSLSMAAGGSGQLKVVIKNTGNSTWSNSTNPIRVANSAYRTSPFQAGSWVNQYRPATLAEATVAPGANGTFTFDVIAPTTPGSYTESFGYVSEGLAWLTGSNLTYAITVN